MTDRRYDLDWLRITAFGLLILYHVGMFYVPWDWHVKSSRPVEALEPLMLLVNPWRLTLLMLISGAATRFMADKMSVAKLTLARMGRLWPPLLVAFLLIVPPQTYYQVVEWVQAGRIAPAALDNFYVRYVTGSGHWCVGDECVSTPTYNHMWFVAYLIIYTLALIPLLPLLRRVPKALSALISGPLFILVPWAFLCLTRFTLFPIFDETHDFRNDWYLHALYFATFLFGFAIAKHEPFFQRCANWRWPALAIALASWLTVQWALHTYSASNLPAPWLYACFRAIHELQAWTGIIAAIGIAHHYLRTADGPIRQTLTQAIFPFYLIHQTIIVVAGHYLDELQLPLALEGALLVGATALGCWLFFQLGRAVPPLRVWIGLPSTKLPQRPAKSFHPVAAEDTA